jgi:16S rRNA (cytidine1402-2'-O)-methyltransferase|tara:strand:+ start:12874 stop:13815 length:942 start_codon:yes stop_codon:yes gene_type:complete
MVEPGDRLVAIRIFYKFSMNTLKQKIEQAIYPATLYVVATPIGNRDDMSRRARDVLSKVDLIAAEDTRHTGLLLDYFGIRTKTVSFHDNNEASRCPYLLARLSNGESIALVSDAGTPLINDPGYRLVRAAHDAGLTVKAVPGASAITAALSICGLPTDRFIFEGFLPVRSVARQSRLRSLARDERTLIFFEAPHRILGTIGDMRQSLGELRQASVVREISKRFEGVIIGPLLEIEHSIKLDKNLERGEIVIIVEGNRKTQTQFLVDPLKLMSVLTEYLPHREASAVAAKITDGRKNDFYRLFLNHLKITENGV